MGLPRKLGPGQTEVAFAFNDHAIRYDENRFVDVTEMWRATGAITNKEFRFWKRDEGASFIRDLASSLNVSVAHVFTSKRGRGGRTFAHWQIALAYAKHLSNEFHRFVNEAFREWAEEQANPDLKAARAVEGYRRRGWDDDRIVARLEGIVQRRDFTDTLQEHGVQKVGYAYCTDAIYKPVLGKTAKEKKLALGLSDKAPLRDNFTKDELAAIRFAESLAGRKIVDGHAHGNGECCDLCFQAGQAVRGAIEAMGLSR